MGCLYRLTSPSGKSYIGITKHTVISRFANHMRQRKYGRGKALHNAMHKYGADRFKIETLVIANDLPYLQELEKQAIQIFGTLSPKGYNLTRGGDSSPFWAPEIVLKIKAGNQRAWARDYENRKKGTKKATDAMKKALEDPVIENARRRKISKTMTGSFVGSNNHAAKINEDIVRQIKNELQTKRTHLSIANDFGICRSLVGLIRQGKRWGHVI